MSELEIKKIIGDPAQLAAELQKFSKNSKLLSSKRAHLISKYAKRWVAIYDNSVKADGTNLNELLTKVDAMNLPRNHVVIRYIDKNARRMIL
jgi:hypothetical protein